MLTLLPNNSADLPRASEPYFSSTELNKYLLDQLLYARHCSGDKNELCLSLFPQRVSNQDRKQDIYKELARIQARGEV